MAGAPNSLQINRATATTAVSTTRHLLAMVLSIALALAACTSPQPTTLPRKPEPSPPSVDAAAQLERRADLSSGRVAAIYRLRAAEIRQREGDLDKAASLIADIDGSLLDTDQWLRLALLQAEQTLAVPDARGAYILLSQHRLLMALNDGDDEIRLRTVLLRARALEGMGSFLAAAQERILLRALLKDEAAVANNAAAIWNNLLQVPNPILQQYLKGAISDTYRGWLELALITKNAQLSLSRQNRELQDWREQWPGHTASQLLPTELASIELMSTEHPDNIAVVLPLTGQLGGSGRAIRDGLLAAYYEALGREEAVPVLRIVDSETTGAFLPLYNRLVSEGSSLVVGPLHKQDLTTLAGLPQLPVPTLALNYIDTPARDQDTLFQFGLSAHDEARQLVSRGRREGWQNALILAPESSWGRDVAETLHTAWREQGGEVLGVVQFGDQREYRAQLADGLLIGASNERARTLQRQLGKHLEFEPRRRQDLDLVLMVAPPAAARALKPLLSFHYAGNIPVYATSHLFAGVPDADRDADLNGTRFVDMPWIANETGSLKSRLTRHSEFRDGRYQRLHALGVDAFRLAPRLRQWPQQAESRVFGETGSLRLNSRNQIIREGEWLQFQNGVPRTESLESLLGYPQLRAEQESPP